MRSGQVEMYKVACRVHARRYVEKACARGEFRWRKRLSGRACKAHAQGGEKKHVESMWGREIYRMYMREEGEHSRGMLCARNVFLSVRLLH